MASSSWGTKIVRKTIREHVGAIALISKRLSVFWGTILLLAAGLANANADSIPGASVVLSIDPAGMCGVTPGYACYIGSYSGIQAIGGIDVLNSTVSVSAFAGGNPSANVGVEGSVDANQQLAAGSTLTYYLEVVGPSGVAVPIDVSGLFIVNSSVLTDDIGISLDLNVASQDLAYEDYGSNSGQPGYTNLTLASGGFSDCSAGIDFVGTGDTCGVSASVVVPSDTIIPIMISVNVGMTDIFGGDDFTAIIDPVLTIGPSFGDASEFLLELSPGFGNSEGSAEVPEPASLAILGAGILLAPRFRRKRKVPISGR
jgi:PEP-CTERM motif